MGQVHVISVLGCLNKLESANDVPDDVSNKDVRVAYDSGVADSSTLLESLAGWVHDLCITPKKKRSGGKNMGVDWGSEVSL